MASLVHRHSKTAVFAATAVFCLPFWLPLLLITSPFLLFTSLFSVGVLTFLKCLFILSLRMQRSLNGGCNGRRRLGMQGQPGLEDVRKRDEGSMLEDRIHEYLEDQLKNLNVVAFGRTESAEDLLPCSFSFGRADGLKDFSNYGLLSHDEAEFTW
ncbi:hypothetical protein L7F22_011735 [Adiantum nelumboides]|nr:hypothetical protein [Adiantum nelumboides]